ncbi:MAG: asparaginase domain-containing protein [Lachnoclostridium sp.]|nr:asparaginase domain-containing protein [Lachnoclostridium sp.]
MNILVIFTGGTIGSRLNEDEGVICAGHEAPYNLIENYVDNGTVSFCTMEPYKILSENLAAGNIEMLVNLIQVHYKNYDGIIVTHGTDTLQYTAAALDIMFDNADIPIMLVSSNYVLTDDRANGQKNFNAAVSFIKDGVANGVFVSYKNENEPVTFHKGRYIQASLSMDDRVRSLRDMYYGQYDGEGHFVYNDEFEKFEASLKMQENDAEIYEISSLKVQENDTEIYEISSLKRRENDTEIHEISSLKRQENDTEIHETASLCRMPVYSMASKKSFRLYDIPGAILRIVPYPGMTYVKPDDRLRVLILESYHSGTIGVNDEFRHFMSEINKLEQSVEVYIAGLNMDESVYETVEEYKKYGVVPFKYGTAIYNYMRLWIKMCNE